MNLLSIELEPPTMLDIKNEYYYFIIKKSELRDYLIQYKHNIQSVYIGQFRETTPDIFQFHLRIPLPYGDTIDSINTHIKLMYDYFIKKKIDVGDPSNFMMVNDSFYLVCTAIDNLISIGTFTKTIPYFNDILELNPHKKKYGLIGYSKIYNFITGVLDWFM
jgi:hypothetical protein